MTSVNLDNTISGATADFKTPAAPPPCKDQGAFDEHLKRAGEAGTQTAASPADGHSGAPQAAEDDSNTRQAESSAEAASATDARSAKEKETDKNAVEGEGDFAAAAAAEVRGERLKEILDEGDRWIAELAAVDGESDAMNQPADSPADGQTPPEEAAGDQRPVAGHGAKRPSPQSKSAKAASARVAPAVESTPDAIRPQTPDQPQAIEPLAPALSAESDDRRPVHRATPQAAVPAPPDAAPRADGKRLSTPRRHVAEPAEVAEVASAADTTGLAAPTSESSADAIRREPSDSESVPRMVDAAGHDKLASAAPEHGAADRAADGHATKAPQATGQVGESPVVGQGDRARFVQRIAKAFGAVDESSGSVRIRLHPPELGSLRLEITVRNGLLSARMETETQTAKNLLLDNLPALRERLVQHDIKIARFEVDYQGGTTGGSPQGPNDQRQPQDQPPRRTRREATVKVDANAAAPKRVVLPAGEGTRLNVLV